MCVYLCKYVCIVVHVCTDPVLLLWCFSLQFVSVLCPALYTCTHLKGTHTTSSHHHGNPKAKQPNPTRNSLINITIATDAQVCH